MARPLKKGNALDDADHVLRHVPYARLARNADDEAIGVLATALAVRPEDHHQLSVNWLEYHDGSHVERVTSAIQAFRAHRAATASKVGKRSGFAIARVGTVKEIGKGKERRFRIVLAPGRGNPSHSHILPLYDEDEELLDALAQDAFTELVINGDIAD